MLLADIIQRLREQIGDLDPIEPNLVDDELTTILKNAASEYSRMKSFIKFTEIPYSNTENVYILPTDSLRVKEVKLKNAGYKLIEYIDNLTEIILEDKDYGVDSDVLKITYIRYLTPEEIDERELDLFLMYAESLCYKLMASKTADLIKFATGEKVVDESGISKKYLELYEASFKAFKKRAIKAYGKRVNNIKENLDYDLPYPIKGENL